MRLMVVVLMTSCLATGCSQGQPSAHADAVTDRLGEVPDGATSDIGVEVATERGATAGQRLAHGNHVYRGIPYAAAPVGDLRRRAPMPASA